VVPPASPPDRKEDTRVRRFLRWTWGRLEGRWRERFMTGVMAILYQSMSMKFRAAAPPWRITLGVLPFYLDRERKREIER